MWWIFALLIALFAPLTTLFAKKGLNGVNLNLAMGIKTVNILVLAWSIVLFKGNFQNSSNLTRQNWIFLKLSNIATGCSWVFYFRAMQPGKLSEVATVDKLSLAFTLILAFIFLKNLQNGKQ